MPRKAPKKRKTKSDRKKLIDKLDEVVREYCKQRAGWRCEKCGRQYEDGDGRLQWSHHFSRRHHGIRWDEDNYSAHCGGCHIYLGGNPPIFSDWVKAKIGQRRFDILQMKKAKPTIYRDADLRLLIESYKERLKALEAA